MPFVAWFGLAGCVEGPILFRRLCLASLLAIVFLAFLKFFSIFSHLFTWVGQLLFGLQQDLSINCFFLNEIRA